MENETIYDRVARKSEGVRAAYRAFTEAMDRGNDAGEAMSLAVDAVTPSIQAQERDDIVTCIRSTTWAGTEEIVQMIRARG